jgi:hypothetical protein
MRCAAGLDARSISEAGESVARRVVQTLRRSLDVGEEERDSAGRDPALVSETIAQTLGAKDGLAGQSTPIAATIEWSYDLLSPEEQQLAPQGRLQAALGIRSLRPMRTGVRSR